MKEHSEDEAELRRYLLGELTLEEQVSVEERLFLDGEYLQLSHAVEDDLADEYAHHDLTPGEREKLEAHFLARSEHPEDLRIAQALKRFISSRPRAADPAPALAVSHPPAVHSRPQRVAEGRGRSSLLSLFRQRPAFSLSLAALVALFVFMWPAIRWVLRPEVEPPLQAHDSRPTPAESPEPRPTPTPGAGLPVDNRPGNTQAGPTPERPRGAPLPDRPPPTAVATFTILPGGSVRGEGRQSGSVRVSAEVGTVVLRLPLVDESEYRGYRAELRTGGRPVHSFDKLSAEVDPEYGKVVPVRVPAGLLRQRSYQLVLVGLTADGRTRDVSSHAFRVEKK